MDMLISSHAEDASMTQDPRWTAVVARDPAADGLFVYSVQTTGVYCRPSCGARLARPENVRFHANGADAEAAGFRPCKRCRPDQPPLAERNAALAAQACRMIDEAEEEPSLDTLANAVGISPYHFHRIFKEATGVTPKAYAAARRAERVRKELTSSRTVTEAIYDAGFNASGRFYARADAVLGMTPRVYRAGGRDVQIRFAVGACSLGAILVAMSAKGICAILLGDDPEALVHDIQKRFPKAELVGDDPNFADLVARTVGLVERPESRADLPLDIQGTAFQQRVWQALRSIPVGETASYREIAERIGKPRAVRAVASACASNPLAVAIPCHRVVRTDGGLAGYRWGIERKRELIARERVA